MEARLRRILPALVALACMLPLAACSSATIRYRLAIEVETPEGVRSGSSVVQVRYAKQLQLLGASAEWLSTITAEAVVVDLGPRGLLFALLKQGADPRSSPEYIVLRAFGFPHGAMPTPAEEGIARIAALRGRADLSLDSLPMLVRFRDPADPTTVERVDPRNLAASFGEGVRLTRAWIEITNDPVTTGIMRLLPWLPGRKEQVGYLHGPRADLLKGAVNLTGIEFSTEIAR
jgi:hypothetical protein